MTKKCRCEDKDTCVHEWTPADDGAGTIVKSNNKMYWGHKAGILGLPRQAVPLDAVAVADGVFSLLLMKLAYQNAEFESRLFVRTSSCNLHPKCCRYGSTFRMIIDNEDFESLIIFE